MTQFTNDFSAEVWSDTYKHHQDGTADETFSRVATAIASVEKNKELRQKYQAEFEDMLSDFKVTSGGRITANAGAEWAGTTLMNCFVGPKPKYDQDSLEGILNVLLSQAQTLKSEGGWGMNFSFIRPRSSFIHGIGVETPGAVKFMEIFDKSSDVITAGSGKKKKNSKGKTKIRKGAMMAVIDCWHPDVMEFVTAKQQEGRLEKFNMSVNCSDEFMDRVKRVKKIKTDIAEQDARGHGPTQDLVDALAEVEDWDLIFPDTTHAKYKKEWNGNIKAWKEKGYPVVVHNTIKVLDLWKLIMESTYNRNEPGVLFMDTANKTHCWNYGGPDAFIAATNPCGEQCLPFGAVCNLASVNLTQFVDMKTRTFNLKAIKKQVKRTVRFLDNVNDYTNAPLPEYEESIKGRRRIGIGVMGWGSALYMLKVRFASDKAEQIKDELMRVFTHSAVEASIDLAIEKGMFKGCDPEKHAAAPFWDQIDLPQSLRNKIKKHGIRNSALFSIQPTGNSSVFANLVSGGLEPVFMPEYIRTSIVNVCPDDLLPFCPKYWEGEMKETDVFKWTTEGDTKILRGEYNDIVYKIDSNRGLTKETLIEDYGVRVMKELGEWDAEADWAATTTGLSVQEHVKDMQGFGKWIDSSMSKTVNLPNDYPFKNFEDLYLDAYDTGFLKGITTYRDGTMTAVLSAANKEKENSGERIVKTKAPKRPQELEAEIYPTQYKGEKLYVALGFLSGDLYEVFAGINPEGDIKHSKGKIFRKSRGKYIFICENGTEYSLHNGHSDENADTVCRLLSSGLRHGVPLEFLVHQVEKTKGDLMSFSKVICRIIKKYIKDNTQISGEECPECGGKLVRMEGCCMCSSCGWSKCG